MKTEFFNDFYRSLQEEVSPEYVKSLKKLIELQQLTEDELEQLIQEVI
ncbi:hypothetical protein [Methanobrevibacter sp.]